MQRKKQNLGCVCRNIFDDYLGDDHTRDGGGSENYDDNDFDEKLWNFMILGNEELVEEMMGKGRVLGGLTAQVIIIIMRSSDDDHHHHEIIIVITLIIASSHYENHQKRNP